MATRDQDPSWRIKEAIRSSGLNKIKIKSRTLPCIRKHCCPAENILSWAEDDVSKFIGLRKSGGERSYRHKSISTNNNTEWRRKKQKKPVANNQGDRQGTGINGDKWG